MPRRNENRNPRTNPLIVISAALAAIVFPLSFAIFLRPSAKLSKTEFSCSDHFHTKTYGNELEVNTVLIGQVHGTDEEDAADCLESLSNTGDHLLLEVPGDGTKEIPCDSLYSTYARFNKKLKCYAFDALVDSNRIMFGRLAYQANFLAKEFPKPLENVRPREIIEKLNRLGDFLIHADADFSKRKAFAKEKGASSVGTTLAISADPDFSKKMGEYLKNLAQKMSKFGLAQINDFVSQENHRLVEEANHYGKLSRKDMTNDALVHQIVAHRQKLVGTEHRLFVAAGAEHVDTAINTHLKKLTEQEESVTILQSNTYLETTYPNAI